MLVARRVAGLAKSPAPARRRSAGWREVEETQTGKKRPCSNSWIAPHNFEGFFLNMGGMIVKQGDTATARRVYANARLSKTYDAWHSARSSPAKKHGQ
jgi:hypothetical protein